MLTKDDIRLVLKETLTEAGLRCGFSDYKNCLDDIKVTATSHAKHHEIVGKFIDLIGTLTTGSCGFFVKMFTGAIVGLILLGLGVWLKGLIK